MPNPKRINLKTVYVDKQYRKAVKLTGRQFKRVNAIRIKADDMSQYDIDRFRQAWNDLMNETNYRNTVVLSHRPNQTIEPYYRKDPRFIGMLKVMRNKVDNELMKLASSVTYEQGQHDNMSTVSKFIASYDGHTNSNLGALLAMKFHKLSNLNLSVIPEGSDLPDLMFDPLFYQKRAFEAAQRGETWGQYVSSLSTK